ncbi:2-aminoethylphosphonate--pyruvate transaminase [Liquorilactobacillus satsumensis]|nr:2-aminoethylphosphonate--pyruvate transaminase [Liquorilactobacillus satsumensis]MCC7667749.1 2-aminoethylphosphonate:pyruvate aminotransferase [Liquorilactobacillus satsumensis]MCP9356920.1 2-aminoethylphosphonate--pyruvate transaminase [Liquorilactobacillus satsumensis]MCP9370867.1 2-aminoethylphosphonate--pyruvate transaminase [Liquorilactobacillus satsumensis]
MTVKAVVFDWAGTTIDYGSRAPILAYQEVFSYFNIPITVSLIRKYIGREKYEQTKLILDDPDEKKIWKEIYPHLSDQDMLDKIYTKLEELIPNILTVTSTLKPGMSQLIAYLEENGIRSATTSGYSQKMLTTLIPLAKKQGFNPLFNITADQTLHIGRPYPDMLNLAINKLQIHDHSQVIKVGDTVNDILEARNAGTISVALIEGGNLSGLTEDEYYSLSPEERQKDKDNIFAQLKEANPDYIINNLSELSDIIENLNKRTLLLTPGPATLSNTVKQAMTIDHGTWDSEYKDVTQKIRTALLKIGHAAEDKYTSILLQGSGTYGVEATLSTAISRGTDTVLIAANGAYGRRMSEIADYAGISHLDICFKDTEPIDEKIVLEMIKKHSEITHFALVHNETTTGIVNPLSNLLPKLHSLGIITIVDAMSSFGGIPLDLNELKPDYLISSSNKCVQGAPGFAFIIANKKVLANTAGNSASLSLDLYQQYLCFENNAGKWRFTSPTHVVFAFYEALLELQDEGGVKARYLRYSQLEQQLRNGLKTLGFEPLIAAKYQSPVITSFKYPSSSFNFDNFYLYLKNHGFIIYPGKITEVASFRIGNIGAVYSKDIARLLRTIKDYLLRNQPKTSNQ